MHLSHAAFLFGIVAYHPGTVFAFGTALFLISLIPRSSSTALAARSSSNRCSFSFCFTRTASSNFSLSFALCSVLNVNASGMISGALLLRLIDVADENWEREQPVPFQASP